MRQMLLQIFLCDPFATCLLIINLIFILFFSSWLCHLDQFSGSDLSPVIFLPVRLFLLFPLVRAA